MGEEEIVMEEVVTGEVAGAETVRLSEQRPGDWLSLENGRCGAVKVVGNVVQGPEVVATEEEGCHVEVEAPPGRLGLRFETGTGHQVTSVAHSSPLAGRVSVGDRLVSIRAPGREFYCGSPRTGSDIVAEFRATAGSERVLTFARGGNVGSVAAQPGHSSPPSHAFPDARSLAGNFCTCFPCFPFVPFSCEKIISHDSNSYQAKGWTIMFLPIHILPGCIPIPLCWDLHLARKHGNTFEVTTPGCFHGNTHNWTSADGFQSGWCCPTGRCSPGAARRGWGGIHVAACAGGLLQVLRWVCRPPDRLNGCWFASMCPIPLIWAIYHNQKVTDDRVRGEQASVGIARRPQRREPFPRRQRLRLQMWHPDPLR